MSTQKGNYNINDLKTRLFMQYILPKLKAFVKTLFRGLKFHPHLMFYTIKTFYLCILIKKVFVL